MFHKAVILSTGLLMGVLLALGGSVLADRSEPQTVVLPVEELRAFTEVFARIKNDYVEEVDDRTLLQHAIRGMLTGLDPHSAYLDTDEYKDLRVGTSGEFGGLGIEVSMEDGFVKVVAPIDETPAARAGIRAGDTIIRLDETPVKGMSLSDAVKMMRGKPNTDLTLTVVRDGEDRPLDITITRAIIKVQSVRSRTLEPGFGYLRITQFQSRTGEDVVRALQSLKNENDGALKGLVLDLRNNPGGVLNASVAVADAFLDQGLIVYTEGRVPGSELKFHANPNDTLEGAPIVVLVNGGSASASEIVAGALQDHRRAIVMGEDTFGKGSVQTIMPMGNETALKLTTARYFTPKGRSIQAHGITPDIPLESVQLAQAEGGFQGLRESDLNRHLRNGQLEEAAPADEEGAEVPRNRRNRAGDSERLELATTDYPLYEALNLLKGMYLMNSRS
ncbi:S41 family peptidase [Ectothiorhodospiraceae bacterium 2226]|nr:S41 family peptidase [Ectothiorhodospiraceae bacterium 2226]